MKTCKTCAALRPTEDFRPSRPTCRDCERKAARDYGAANRLKRNARLSRWRQENPDKAAAADRRKALKKNYGLTESDIEAMRFAQGGRCAICSAEKPLMVDHCHATGRVRGLLCARCNTGLGWIEATPNALGRIAGYLGDPCHADVLLELANRPTCHAVTP